MIRELKNSANRLEIAYNSYNKMNFEKEVQSIKDIIDKIQFVHETEDIKSKQDLQHFVTINTIPFMVKLVEPGVDPYEGTYLEKFCDRRTDDLMKSRAINNHNAFWKQHTTLAGNIYGSVPKELLKPENVESLDEIGWVEVEVDIIDTTNIQKTDYELTKFISEYMDSYVIVKENSTDTVLVLRYNL